MTDDPQDLEESNRTRNILLGIFIPLLIIAATLLIWWGVQRSRRRPPAPTDTVIVGRPVMFGNQTFPANEPRGEILAQLQERNMAQRGNQVARRVWRL